MVSELKGFLLCVLANIETIQRIHTQQGFHQAKGVCEDISKSMENSKGNSPNQWDNFNFRDDEGTTLGIHKLQLLLQKLQDAQENPKLSPMVQNLLATRDLTLRNTWRPPSRMGEPLPEDDNLPIMQGEAPREDTPTQVLPLTMSKEEERNKERSPSPKRGRKRRRSQERISRRRSPSSESTSSSKSGRNPHGRFHKGRKQAPSPSPNPPSSNGSTSSHESSFSSKDLKRKKALTSEESLLSSRGDPRRSLKSSRKVTRMFHF